MTTVAPAGSLLTFAVGGGWGDEEASAETTPCLVVRGTDLMSVRGGSLDSVPLRYETPKKMASRALQEGDIILEISGGSKGQPTGRTALVTQQLLDRSKHPVIPASFCRLLRPDRSQVHPRYLYYWLQEMYSSGRVWSYQNQSTGIANFQMKVFTQVEMVRLPPLEEQERIAGVLAAFDDLIETNRRLIDGLLALAETAYLRAASSLPLVRLGDLVHLNYGKALPARDRVPGGVPVVSSAGITGMHDKALVSGPGVVVGRKGTVGTVTWVRDDFYPIDTAFYAVSELPVELTFQTLAAAGLAELNSDSAVPGLNRDRAMAQLVPDVRGEPSDQVGEVLSTLMSASDDLVAETEAITAQRDELLPLLMSGKVRVRDVEAAVS